MTWYVQDPHISYLTNLAYHINLVTSLSTKTVTSGYDVVSHLIQLIIGPQARRSSITYLQRLQV